MGVARLTYVFKEALENTKKVYILELTKNQQKTLDIPKDVLRHLTIGKVTEDQITNLPFPPEEIIVSKLLLAICTKIRDHWNRNYGIPCFTVKFTGSNSVWSNYRGVIVPYYVDRNLDSVHQFLEWEEALSNFNSFHLIRIDDDGQNFTELSDHRSAVSFIRRELTYYMKYKKPMTKKIEVHELPTSVVHRGISEIEKATGLQIDPESVKCVEYRDIKDYKQKYLALQTQYQHHIIYTYPLVHGSAIYTLLVPLIIPDV